MNIWSRIFAEKFSIIFKVFARTDRGGGSAKCGQVWIRGRGSKITENVDILYKWPLIVQLCVSLFKHINLLHEIHDIDECIFLHMRNFKIFLTSVIPGTKQVEQVTKRILLNKCYFFLSMI